MRSPAIIVRRKIAAALIALVASCGSALAVGGDGINNPGSSGGGSTTITINSTPIVGCGTAGGALYGGSNLVQCSAGVTMSDTTLSLGTGVTLTAPDTGTWTSAGIAIKAAGSVTTPALSLTNFETGTGLYVTAIAKMGIAVSGTLRADFGISTGGTWSFTGTVRNSGSFISSSNVGSLQVRNGATILSSPATATWQLGTADAATAVAQTLEVQNVVAGTSNVSGANWTLIGSLSTGSGTSGNIVLQTGGTGAAAAVQNAAVTALTIAGGTQAITTTGTLTVGTLASATGLFVCETAGLLSSGVTTCVASDRAVKHDIIAIDDRDLLGNVLNKRGVRFTYNKDKGAPGRRIGVIANEWEDDFPELVDTDSQGIRHFDYAATWGLSVELFKIEHAQIQALNSRLYDLERRRR